MSDLNMPRTIPEYIQMLTDVETKLHAVNNSYGDLAIKTQEYLNLLETQAQKDHEKEATTTELGETIRLMQSLNQEVFPYLNGSVDKLQKGEIDEASFDLLSKMVRDALKGVDNMQVVVKKFTEVIAAKTAYYQKFKKVIDVNVKG